MTRRGLLKKMQFPRCRDIATFGAAPGRTMGRAGGEPLVYKRCYKTDVLLIGGDTRCDRVIWMTPWSVGGKRC